MGCGQLINQLNELHHKYSSCTVPYSYDFKNCIITNDDLTCKHILWVLD